MLIDEKRAAYVGNALFVCNDSAVVAVMVLIPVMSVVAIIAAVTVSVAFAVTAFFTFFARFFTGSVFAVVATGIEYGVEC